MTNNYQKRILVIEDDDLFREAMRDTLGERYAICEAESADEALTALQKSMYDLVLLDINLPDKNGLLLLRQIKERWPVMPVIMITAYDSVPQVVESIRNGAFDYLTKPIRSEELLLSIDRALDAYEMQSELQQRRRLQLSEATAINIVGKT